MIMEESGIQANSSPADRLKPWQYKKGQSGNPSGKTKGTLSMKTYVKNKLLAMAPKEREEYLEGLDKSFVWQMGEGTPNTTHEITVDTKAPLTDEELKLKKEYDQRLKDLISKKD